MATSILFYAFGLKGIEYRAIRYLANYIICSAEMNGREFTCPQCGGDQVIHKGNKKRWSPMPPIGRKLCMLDPLLHRVQCWRCHHVWWSRLLFMLAIMGMSAPLSCSYWICLNSLLRATNSDVP